MSEFTLIRDQRDEETSDYIYDVCQSCGAEIIINIFDDSPSLCVDCTFSPVSNVPSIGSGETLFCESGLFGRCE